MSVAKDRRRRQGNGLDLSCIYDRRFPVVGRMSKGDVTYDLVKSPFSMNSEMMNIRPSGDGARESPRYNTTFGWRASLMDHLVSHSSSTVIIDTDFISLHSLSKYLETS